MLLLVYLRNLQQFYGITPTRRCKIGYQRWDETFRMTCEWLCSSIGIMGRWPFLRVLIGNKK